MGGLKSVAKSLKRFVKKNTKEIATIAGLFIPGVGPVLGEAAMAGAQIYAAGSMMKGAGFGFDGTASGTAKFYNSANAGVSGTGITGFFEGVGANTAAALGANVPGAAGVAGAPGTLATIGESFEGLNLLQKAGILLII